MARFRGRSSISYQSCLPSHLLAVLLAFAYAVRITLGIVTYKDHNAAIMFKRLLLTLAATGWLVPLWLSSSLALKWAEIQQGGAVALNSIPFLDAIHKLLLISLSWLTVVTILGAWRLSKSMRPHDAIQ